MEIDFLQALRRNGIAPNYASMRESLRLDRSMHLPDPSRKYE